MSSRRTRRLVAPVALLVTLAVTVLVPPAPVLAAWSAKSYHSLGDASHPDWMGWVPDGTSLGSLSIPGTHESLAINGGDIAENQEDYGTSGATLARQLDAGIRAVDIRVHRIDDAFTIHHGAIYQNANFADVLRVLGQFLTAHPRETVVMRLKAECTGEAFSCTDIPTGTTSEDRRVVFEKYLDHDPNARFFYPPTVTGDGPADVPTLGQVRGRIVLSQFVGAGGGIYRGYGLRPMVDDGWQQYVQDQYEEVNIANKWSLVRDHLDRTNTGSTRTMYENFSSAATGLFFPRETAGGADHDGGVNMLLVYHLLQGHAARTGMMMMDFPGAGLIDAIVALNARLAPFTEAVGTDLTERLGNVTAAGEGDAQARHTLLRDYLSFAAPQALWNTAVVSGSHGYYVNYGTVLADDGGQQGYRALAWPSELGTSSTGKAALAPAVDATIGDLSGDDEARAKQLSETLTAKFPNQWWSVIVHEGDGGFANWTTQTYGVSYQPSVDGRAYLVTGQDKGTDESPDPGAVGQRIAYFPSWSVYGNAFYPRTLDTNGTAARLTTMMYAFENIDPVKLTCMAANKAGTSDDNDPDGNDGAGDAWADYQMGFTADKSVDGVADQWGQPLKGNFNQLKKLKVKYPNLKILVSIGGWTYAKWFSDAAATPSSRTKLVSSCVDMFIRGDLPKLGDDPAGGPGAAAGVFDGIDIDWEFPATEARPGNHHGPQDTANYTALLAEFRRQLDALGGKHYALTAALPSGPDAIKNIQVAQIGQYLDSANVMSYDMHGGWEPKGPTNFQAPLYDSARSPANGGGLTADAAIRSYLNGGFPAGKLTLGVPFYARGWTGVPAGDTAGLYQPATGPTAPLPYSQAAGVAMYKELAAAGKLGDVHFDKETKGAWVHVGSDFFSVESAESLAAKRRYIKDKGLAGVMIYSLEADPSATLVRSATGIP